MPERLSRVHSLAALGAEGVPGLCLALSDEALTVRKAAAEALGRVGDERAIPALQRALRAGFFCGSGRLNRWMGAGWAAAGLGTYLLLGVVFKYVWPHDSFVERLVSMAGSFAFWGTLTYFFIRQGLSEFTGVVSEAMLQVAERHPGPQWRNAAGDLDWISADPLQQSKSTREIARTVRVRLQELAGEVEALPVPASAPASLPESLPRPATPPQPGPQSLPHPCAGGDVH